MSDRRKQWAQWANLGTTPTYSIPDVTDEQRALVTRRVLRMDATDIAPALGLALEPALTQKVLSA